jgi:hypothetical protein
MNSAGFELQKAIFDALRAETALTGALGGARIHDAAPADVPFPYITFGRTSIYDWSTATEDGTEHLVSLHFWSKGRGKKEALALMEIAGERLRQGGLVLEGYQLVNLTQDYAEVRFDEDLGLHHGLLRFRAMVEKTG